VVICILAAAVTGAARPGTPPARAGSERTLWHRLARALVVPQVSPARTAAFAMDLESGKVLFAKNGTRSLAPASNEKLAVTYTALVVLGPGFRSRTDVLGEGHQVGPTWHGNLVLKGYGDPTLTGGRLTSLAKRIRRLGIRHVRGRVVADESFFDARRTAPGWRPSFYLDECPALSALVVDRGRTGAALTGRPALAAAAAYTRALRSLGVSVAGRPARGVASASAQPLASSFSPPLWKVLRFMDRESDNFTAEMLLKELGGLYGGRGSTGAGAAVVTRTLASDGVPLAGVRIVDGSGLSLLDRVTARALVGILQSAWASPQVRPTFFGVLAVAGRNGTLRDRMGRRPTRGNVVAKTGTTSRSSALSGYVKRRFAFSVLNNGFPIASWWAERAQDRFVTTLASIK
jgi:serine-type D-Ala-D-Ala carboxypeptidase/endopeptidase (penicillin-binding protein 4)